MMVASNSNYSLALALMMVIVQQSHGFLPSTGSVKCQQVSQLSDSKDGIFYSSTCTTSGEQAKDDILNNPTVFASSQKYVASTAIFLPQKHRRILIEELGYRRKDADRMRLELALVVVQKRMRCPPEGMPRSWMKPETAVGVAPQEPRRRRVEQEAPSREVEQHHSRRAEQHEQPRGADPTSGSWMQQRPARGDYCYADEAYHAAHDARRNMQQQPMRPEQGGQRVGEQGMHPSEARRRRSMQQHPTRHGQGGQCDSRFVGVVQPTMMQQERQPVRASSMNPGSYAYADRAFYAAQDRLRSNTMGPGQQQQRAPQGGPPASGQQQPPRGEAYFAAGQEAYQEAAHYQASGRMPTVHHPSDDEDAARARADVMAASSPPSGAYWTYQDQPFRA